MTESPSEPSPALHGDPAETIALGAGTTVVPTLQPGTRFGDYVLLDQIGEGGMGVVFRARQQGPVERDVAIKLLRPGVVSDEQLARFAMEQRALASLNHPSVVVVHDAGRLPEELGGLPYVVMEWVEEGEPLQEFADQIAGLDIAERMEVLAEVCDAVQHAHNRGIVHRDLKSANILCVDTPGNQVVKVIDFGLARPVGQRRVHGEVTQPGAFVGTPSSMSPEQLDGPSGVIDTRTDVYGLGAVLYELLTGTPPHRFGSGEALDIRSIQESIRNEPLELPSDRVARIRREKAGRVPCGPDPARWFSPRKLRREPDWICARALAKDPDDRYQSVDALARDLRAYAGGMPVSVGPATGAYRVGCWVRRHRYLVGVSVLAGIALILATLVVVAKTIEAEAEAERAAQAEERALEAARNERLRADEAEHAREVTRSVTDFLADVLGAADPAVGNVEISIPDALRLAVGKAEERYGDDPEQLSEILATAGRTLRRIGREDDAMRALRRRLEILDAAVGDSTATAGWASPDQRVEARNDLAIGLKHIGDIEGAIELYRDTLTFAEQHGLDRRRAVLTMNLAVALEKLGRIEEAVEFCEQSRVLHEQVFPDSPERTAIVVSRVSSLQHEQGRYEESLETAQQAVAMFRELYGDKPHPYLANALTLIAPPAMKLERFELAEKASAEAIGIYEKAYGKDHSALMVLLSNQVQLLLRLSRDEEALAVAARGAELAFERGERADWLRGEFLRQQADAALALERFDDAERMATRAISFAEASTGRMQPGTLPLARTTRAESFHLRELLDEAEASYREAWEDAQDERVGGEIRSKVAKRIADFYERLGRAEEAAVWRARVGPED